MTRIIVLDTSAIINELPASYSSDCRYITTPDAVKELSKEKHPLFELGRLEERIPKEEFLKKIRAEVEQTKDKLSKQDIGLLAIALEFNAEIATDDYGMQNIAKKLGIGFIPVGEHGIKEVFHWQYYCPACWKKFDSPGICDVCGTKLKRKVKK